MMLVNQKDLREFMRLYKDEFGNDITEGEAEEIISRLITLYTKLSEPLPCEHTKHHETS